jgi:hypothetical protein
MFSHRPLAFDILSNLDSTPASPQPILHVMNITYRFEPSLWNSLHKRKRVGKSIQVNVTCHHLHFHISRLTLPIYISRSDERCNHDNLTGDVVSWVVFIK